MTKTLDELQKSLTKDEEWLKDFRKCLSMNDELSRNVCSGLDNFNQQIEVLRQKVGPLCAKTADIQKKQQNMKKLLGMIEASIQFYGKSVEFESAFRRGSANFSLEEYLERMSGLKEAIDFFSQHAAHRNQLDIMKESFETGCSFLETEFTDHVRSETRPLDPAKLADCLDENYEISSTRYADLQTIKDTTKLALIVKFLQKNSMSTEYLNYFVNYRAQNISKTIRLANDQLRGFVQHKTNRSQFFKSSSALKRASGRVGERDLVDPWGESVMTMAAISFSVLIALIQIETEVVHRIFNAVDVEAQLVRRIAAKPLQEVMEKAPVEDFDANFVGMLPLVRFLATHSNQLDSLSRNAGQADLYQGFCARVFGRGAHVIHDFIDHLTNEHMRFVPEDGNVHEVTSNTINFLKILAKYQAVVVHVLQKAPKHEDKEPGLPKLFAQILAALGVNLKNKSAAYADPHLAALFMFNNLTYMRNGLREEALRRIVRDQNLAEYYEQQCVIHLKKYLESWNRVLAVLDEQNNSSVKSKYANFNKEFDSVIATQKHYCVVDLATAQQLRHRIKELVLKPYAEFTTKHSQEAYHFNLDRQLKYDAESVEIIINRLFDVSY